MNRVIWAEMQSLDVLQQVDLMLPDLVSVEEEEARWHGDRYRRVKESRDALSTEKTGKAKVAIGISLVAAGTAALLMPGNAFMAAKIQLSFSLGFSYIGGMIGGPWGAYIGFQVGTIVGGIVAAVWVYGIPMVQIATGLYLIGSGLYEMMG